MWSSLDTDHASSWAPNVWKGPFFLFFFSPLAPTRVLCNGKGARLVCEAVQTWQAGNNPAPNAKLAYDLFPESSVKGSSGEIAFFLRRDSAERKIWIKTPASCTVRETERECTEQHG